MSLQSSVFVIAEAGVNHNGSVATALALCDAAKEAGADAVKFQSFRAEDLVVPGAPTASYQQTSTGASRQFEMLKALELDQHAHAVVLAHCAQIGIEFFSTPFSIHALQMLVDLGVKRLKLSSAELTHPQLIEAAAATSLPLILSTGMGTLEEVRVAVGWYEAMRGSREGLSLLHCTSAYPAPDAALNLRAMQTLAHSFDVPVGYSDHSEGAEASLAAAALGACIIEKHLTLNRNMPGPDHRASMEPQAFAAMVTSIRRIEQMLGDGEKRPNEAERNTAQVARRSVVLDRDVVAGQALHPSDLAMRRPATGISPVNAAEVVGRCLRRAGHAGQVLFWEDLEDLPKRRPQS
jgi:N,N'-diacetyllegionaminate synthase